MTLKSWLGGGASISGRCFAASSRRTPWTRAGRRGNDRHRRLASVTLAPHQPRPAGDAMRWSAEAWSFVCGEFSGPSALRSEIRTALSADPRVHADAADRDSSHRGVSSCAVLCPLVYGGLRPLPEPSYLHDCRRRDVVSRSE